MTTRYYIKNTHILPGIVIYSETYNDHHIMVFYNDSSISYIMYEHEESNDCKVIQEPGILCMYKDQPVILVDTCNRKQNLFYIRTMQYDHDVYVDES